ncbi:LINE-1 type transposase domain-containing protein 1 [Nycticebus coucang]|uniref:LINE-1 type transposase domain-containing protein 1 n=1 Tax=Nycticebus coucang TaxID=9470 RepID=UPI00234CD02A|nr:LINE-1 type transposase domain-containing protein 1 [Nycticebus coucang]
MSGYMKNQIHQTPPRDHDGATTEDSSYKEIAEMTDVEFRVWLANKLNRVEELLVKEFKKELQKAGDQILKDLAELRKDIRELTGTKESFRDSQNRVGSFNNGLNHGKGRFSQLEDKALELTQSFEDPADFLSAALDTSKQWSHVFSILRENDYDPKLLCQVKLAFKCDGGIKEFSDLQSLSKFISQKSSMKELLKDALSQNEKMSQEGRSFGIQEKVGETQIGSKHGAGRASSDGSSFLWSKEVKTAKPEDVKNVENLEDSSEWKEKEPGLLEDEEVSEVEEEASGLEEEDAEASGLEEEDEEEASGLEEEDAEASGLEEEDEEEASGLEEEDAEASGLEEEDAEASGLEEEDAEEASGLEEEDAEASGLEEEDEEEASGLEEEDAEASGLEEEERGETSLICEDQGHAVVDAKRGVEEITGDGVDIILVGVEENSEPEEDEEEGNVSEIGKVGAAIQVEKKGGSGGLKQISSSCLVSKSKEKWMKHQVADKTHKMHSCANLDTTAGVTKNFRETDNKIHKFLQTKKITSKKIGIIQETEENFRRSVINSIREMQEEIKSIKDYHPEVSNIKNSIDELNSGMDVLEERLNSLEDQIEEFSQDTIQMTKQIISKERLRDIEDRSRSSNIRLIGIPEKNNNENAAEDIIKEIIDENFPELKKESTLEIVSASRIPSKIDKRKLTPRHILVKFYNSSDKERILRASRERKEITYHGTRIRLTADLSLDTLDARSRWSAVIKVLQDKGFKPRILYPAKLAFDFQGKTKTFLDIEEFKKSISHIPSLKELLENIF